MNYRLQERTTRFGLSDVHIFSGRFQQQDSHPRYHHNNLGFEAYPSIFRLRIFHEKLIPVEPEENK